MLNRTETAVIEPLTTGPILAVTKTILVNAKIIECPAIILANKRIINANGLVKIPNNSIIGIKGIGHFKNTGTSGHSISFQYSLEPNKLMAKKVHIANTIVTAILPVTFPPPGNTGISPIMLLIKIKKKAVSK